MKNLTKACLMLGIIGLTALCSFAQFPIKIDKTIKDVTRVVNSGTQAVASLGMLVNTAKRTSAEFDKTVVVDNSETPKPVAPPKKEITEPKFKKGTFTNIDWEPVTYFDGQLFPSMIISMADYKGDVGTPSMKALKSSALGFRFISKASYMPVKWEIESTDKSYFDTIGGDYTFQQSGQERYFMPNIPWNMSVLAKQSSSTTLNIIFRLIDDDGNKVEKSVPVLVRSVNDCIFQYKDLDLQFLFAAFIQEQHPEIDKILQEALATKTIAAITGYQWGPEETKKQVAAVWRVLHDRGFQYSSISAAKQLGGANIASQQVRTFDNAIRTNQANCIDGAVVLASILRAIGIRTMIVTQPGHAYLGYYPSNEPGTKPVFLETTMLGDPVVFSQAQPPAPKTPAKTPVAKNAPKTTAAKAAAAKTAADKVQERLIAAKNQAYMVHFERALQSGQSKYDKNSVLNQVNVIDVNLYRQVVRPLPF